MSFLQRTPAATDHRLASILRVSGLGVLLGFASITTSGVAADTVTPSDAAHRLPGSATVAKIHRWLEVGKASWYGLKFQGRKTATGEPFDMNDLTCAHRTLPLGSWVRVTNLHNRKSVVVRVNDRGPMIGSRIVDLSYAAARVVGLDGVAKVRIEPAPGPDPAPRTLIATLRMPPSLLNLAIQLP